MASISSKTFTVESDDTSEESSRAARRVIFHADVLKAAKICTGDIVALVNGVNLNSRKVYNKRCDRLDLAHSILIRALLSELRGLPLKCLRAVSQPLILRLPSPHDALAVLVPTSLRLTARLRTGDQVQIHALSGATSLKLSPGLPSLRNLQEAGTIRLREVSVLPKDVTKQESGTKRNWLDLLLRESLGAICRSRPLPVLIHGFSSCS